MDKEGLFGVSPLEFCSLMKHNECFKFLVNYSSTGTLAQVLLVTVGEGDIEKSSILLEKLGYQTNLLVNSNFKIIIFCFKKKLN